MVKVEDAVSAVKRWFHVCEGRWLVILNSADTIDDNQQKSYIDLDISSLTRRKCMLLSSRGTPRLCEEPPSPPGAPKSFCERGIVIHIVTIIASGR